MIRARASNGTFILGIDAENVKRLREGKPILVSLAELGGSDDVLIMLIPLCIFHHRGKSGVHGMGTGAFAEFYGFSTSRSAWPTRCD